MRDWTQERRARTRRLIEYGGLVAKAGLPERVADDRATMLGAFLRIRDQLDDKEFRDQCRAIGLDAFEDNAATAREDREEVRATR